MSKKRKRLEAAVSAIQQRWGHTALQRGARPVAALPVTAVVSASGQVSVDQLCQTNRTSTSDRMMYPRIVNSL